MASNHYSFHNAVISGHGTAAGAGRSLVSSVDPTGSDGLGDLVFGGTLVLSLPAIVTVQRIPLAVRLIGAVPRVATP
jgi:hypothetical protein